MERYLMLKVKEVAVRYSREETTIITWCNLLVAFGGVSFWQALEIAEGRLSYHRAGIEELRKRQMLHYSKKVQMRLEILYGKDPLRFWTGMEKY